MRTLVQGAAIAAMLFGFHGCSGLSPEELAANADARVGESGRAAANTGVVSEVAGIVIPSGTSFKVSLVDALDSDTNSTGDHFLTVLSEFIMLNGRTVLEKGTTIRGRVVDVEGAGRVNGLASIQLMLTDADK